MNNLNRLTLQQDDTDSPPDKTGSQVESVAFRTQFLFNILTVGMIIAALAIPYWIMGNYRPRTPVNSSDIVSVGHNLQSNKLVIEFKGGRVYEYADVPAEVYDDLMAAESHGAYFFKEIKNAGYKFKQLK